MAWTPECDPLCFSTILNYKEDKSFQAKSEKMSAIQAGFNFPTKATNFNGELTTAVWY